MTGADAPQGVAQQDDSHVNVALSQTPCTAQFASWRLAWLGRVIFTPPGLLGLSRLAADASVGLSAVVEALHDNVARGPGISEHSLAGRVGRSRDRCHSHSAHNLAGGERLDTQSGGPPSPGSYDAGYEPAVQRHGEFQFRPGRYLRLMSYSGVGIPVGSVVRRDSVRAFCENLAGLALVRWNDGDVSLIGLRWIEIPSQPRWLIAQPSCRSFRTPANGA